MTAAALSLMLAAVTAPGSVAATIPPVTAPTATDTLVAGCAGGITGGGEGAAATSAGELLRFSHEGPGSPEGTAWTLVRRDTTLTRQLFGRLARSGFDRIEYRNPANMTCYLSRRGGRTHEVAWPMGQRPRRIIRIVAIYDDVRRAVGAR